MSAKQKIKHILTELRSHVPFTVFGASVGVIFMLIFRNIGRDTSYTLFSFFHPAHVVLSAMVTASLFSLHKEKKNFLLILVVGYVGSIGIATFSDSVIPHIGEGIIGLRVSAHSQLHGQVDQNVESSPDHQDDDEAGMYLGFIEDWYIINPAALLGVLIAYLLPRTKLPHAGHVLISTWASLSHILMNINSEINVMIVFGIFVILFVAVWLPCCISDIIFPLLFVKGDFEVSDHEH